MSPATRNPLQRAVGLACGILVLVLCRWTPTTGRGILLYALLFAVAIALAIGLTPSKGAGYWPNKPDNHWVSAAFQAGGAPFHTTQANAVKFPVAATLSF